MSFVGGLMIVFLILVVGGIGAGVTVLAIRAANRKKYVAAINARGWRFIDNPGLLDVAMLHCPPFGRQFDRTPDELARGQAPDGTWFQAFDYRTGEFRNRVLTIRLPATLPELYVLAADRPRPGVTAPPVAGFEPWLVCSADEEYARAFLSPAVLAALAGYGRTHPLDISVDGDHLVAIGAPTDPDLLERAVASLAAVVRAIDPQVIERWAQPQVARGYTFHGQPDWVYVGRNDHLLRTVQVTGGGQAHRTAEVVTSINDGLPFVAFRHHWQTTYTTTTTGANGITHTQTHTRHHQESILEFALPFQSPSMLLSYDHQSWLTSWSTGLAEIDFEAQHFNDRFDVRCASSRFAYDVIHPRQMEYLLRTQPPPFVWGDGRATFRIAAHDQDIIAWVSDFFHGFLQRVPGFVWKDLQAPPPVRSLEP